MAEDIKQILEEHKKDFDNKFEETNRHFDVVAEDIKDKIATVSEQVAANAEKIATVSGQVAANAEKIENLSGQVSANTETLEIIKLNIEVIKNDLKQKVSREEFVILEKRVDLLEAKQK